MTEKPGYRYAIYTRKSTEGGLEQDFNSLDAQRDACEAFGASQAGLGWKLNSKHYDDGGISGAHIDRPALQALLDDIRSGKIDVVVVYKIDRLTRSLTDFARIVEVFNKHDVSFVSVTQQFNTTTSMGRLTLNVLLSFAQFEREVTAERIRDKITASKKKGMWMGGLPPLGFDVENKQLLVNEAEAETVRTLFNLYLELKSVRRLKIEADRLGLRTKRRIRCGVETGGKFFARGHLYQLLSNPLYVGDVAHKGQTYPGQHQPIIDRESWVAVQALLSDNAAPRHTAVNSKEPSLLVGLLYDETGDRLSPSHATKSGRRYRYYVSHRLMQAARKNSDGWRIPAREIETLVVEALTQFLSNERKMLDLTARSHRTPDVLATILEKAKVLRGSLASASASEKRQLVRTVVLRADLAPGLLQIEISGKGLVGLLAESTSSQNAESIFLKVPFKFRKRGVEAKLVVEGSNSPVAGPDQMLIETVAKGFSWFEDIVAGRSETVRQIAQRDAVDEGDVSRMIGFAFLAPDIIEAIVHGRQPLELTAERLKRSGNLPYSWDEQRHVLGFSK